MPTYKITIILLSLLVLATTTSVVVQRWKDASEPDTGFLPSRRGDEFADQALHSVLIALALIVFTHIADKPRLTDFGYQSEASLVVSFCIGLGCYAVFIAAFELITALLGVRRSFNVGAYLTHRQVWPRRKAGRRKLLAALLINPFTEEFIYRGFLVFYLGHLLDAVPLFALIGMVTCLAAHSYQDLRVLPFHLAYYVVAITLLFSPWGLIACFGMHLAGDLAPLAGLRSQLRAWKESRRRAESGPR